MTERDENIICGIIVGSYLNSPEKTRLCGLVRAALHGSQAGPQESELSWDDLHHGPLTATEGFRRHVKEIAKQLDAHTWTGLMAGFAPVSMDFYTTNSGDVGGPLTEKP